MTDLQKELIEFVSACEKDKSPRPLKRHLVEGIIEQIVRGEREIGDIATNSKTGDVFVRFCFTEGNHDPE